MRLTEFFRIIRNKFIRQDIKTQPEGKTEIPEDSGTEEEIKENHLETALENTVEMRILKREKAVGRYRHYALYHKKKRVRKKYMNRLKRDYPDEWLKIKLQPMKKYRGIQIVQIGVDSGKKRIYTMNDSPERLRKLFDQQITSEAGEATRLPMLGGNWHYGSYAGSFCSDMRNPTNAIFPYEDSDHPDSRLIGGIR